MARYLVTQHPGANVPGVGFVTPGQEFTAPEGYEPSRTFLPLDKDAQDALGKVLQREKDRLEKVLAEAGDDATGRVLKAQVRGRLEEVEKIRKRAQEVAAPPAPPAKKEEGLTLAEFGAGKKSGRASDTK